MSTSLLRDSLPDFMGHVYRTLGYDLYKPQVKCAAWIQEQLEEGGPDKISKISFHCFRNFGKSLFMGAALIPWFLYRDPDDTILLWSASQNHAKKIVNFSRQIIMLDPLLAELRPRQNDIWGATEFVVGNRTVPQKDSSVAAYGIGSQVTGSHVNKLICDDLEIVNNSRTKEARDKIFEAFIEADNVVNPGGCVLNIGTYQSIDSVHIRVTRELGYKTLRFPPRYPQYSDDHTHGGMWCLAPWLAKRLEKDRDLAGVPTFPERLPEEECIRKEAESRTNWALQFMLDPELSNIDMYPLKLRDIIVLDLDRELAPSRVAWGSQKSIEGIESAGLGKDRFYEPAFVSDEYLPYEAAFMWVDPAGRGADEVGYAVGKILNGTVYIPEAGGLDGGYDEPTLKQLADIANRNGVKKILVEPDWGDGMYTISLRRVVRETLGLDIGVEDAPKAASRGSKEQWVCDVLEPVLGSHRLVVNRRVARDTELMYQLTHITRERGCLTHDDRVEALAGVVSLFSNQMHQDIDKLESQRADEKVRKAVEEWDRRVHKRKPKPKGLIHKSVRWFPNR